MSDLDPINLGGLTPLQVACDGGWLEIVSFLLHKNANFPISTAGMLTFKTQYYHSFQKNERFKLERIKIVRMPEMLTEFMKGADRTPLFVVAEASPPEHKSKCIIR